MRISTAVIRLGEIMILDEFGKPFPVQAKPSPQIQARFDNAFTTDQSVRNWWPADYLSAKAANSFQVRRTLRIRSRYEVSNNPRLWGVAVNNATDLINTGPTLQCLTGDKGTNGLIESLWQEWCQEVNFTQKLITAKLAETVDGEGFLISKTVNEMESPCKLWPVDIEADQVTNPMPLDPAQWQTDGIELHPVTGEPKTYHVLKYHPGDYWFGYDMNPLKVEAVPARDICQLFPKFRPGQVRGLPIFTPSLDLFTELRAFRKSTLDAAATAANHSAVLTSEAPPGLDDDDADEENYNFRRVGVNRNMMTILPKGMTMAQLRAEHPNATFQEFSEFGVAEAIRPLAYPLNLALGSSQKFNFSSAKLDHINYRNTLTIERVNKIEPVIVEKQFREFIRELSLAGILPSKIRSARDVRHAWHWPGFESLDPLVDANADQLRLAGGQDTWQDFCARRGMDWRHHFAKLSEGQRELERLEITIGEPTKQSVTETVQVDDEGEPVKKEKPKRSESELVNRLAGVEA